MTVLGLMSGTSLDGLDLALCDFEYKDGSYHFNILKAKTVEYNTEQKEKLSRAASLTAERYFALHRLFGKFTGEQINLFLKDEQEKPDAIASHGHTIFHQPQFGFTSQIGCGATIAGITGITTVCDFRSLDVANGGQGAPLVPIGDQLLFGKYDACLNIGGIANISYEKNAQRIAYDVCFANMALNYLAEKLGKPFDENGKFASTGKTDEILLKELKRVLFIENKISLSREGFERTLIPIFREYNTSLENKLATFCTYVSDEIAKVLNENNIKNVLISGGGSYNSFLIELVKNKFKGEVILPVHQTIQFKEAVIFAFLGYLRLNEKINTLKSVTGARTDSVGGAVYFVKA